MFCKNCGSKVPDNSMFCQVCGTKLGESEQVQKKENDYGSFSGFGYDEAPRNDYRRESASRGYSESAEKVSFDWSNVKDETHKKEIRDIASPWDSPLYSDDAEFNPAPSKDHSRTLSFIEILKQEREEKLHEAEKQASEYTRRQETPTDYSLFDDAPRFDQSRYEASRYEEPKYEAPRYEEAPRRETSRYEAPRYDEPKYEAPRYEESPRREASRYEAPRYDEPKYEAARYEEAPRREASRYEAPRYDEPKYEAPRYEEAPRREASRYEAPRYDEPKYEAPRYEESPRRESSRYDEPAYEAGGYEKYLNFDIPSKAGIKEDKSISSLSWLDDDEDAPINTAPASSAIPTSSFPVFEEAQTIEIPTVQEQSESAQTKAFSVEEDILASDSANLSAELDAILGLTADPVKEATTNKEPEDLYLSDEPIADKHEVPSLDDILSDSPFEQDSVMEKRATITSANADDEVEALKRRLAELTGTYDDVPGYQEKVVNQAQATAVGAVVETSAAPKTTVAPETSVTLETPVVEQPQATMQIPSDDAEDALSVEELEKDLFGDTAADEFEATKKIDKFYTLYKKNEEFQKLLDEEYNKLKADNDGIADTSAIPSPSIPEFQSQPEPVASQIPQMSQTSQVDEFRAAPAQSRMIEPEPRNDGFRELDMSRSSMPTRELEEEPELSRKEERQAAKAEKKAAKAAAKAAKNEIIDDIEDDDEEQGGGALTVIAVVIAVLLVILLGIILVLNFAPDSGIAMKIDAVIENIASYFTVVDDFKNGLLL